MGFYDEHHPFSHYVSLETLSLDPATTYTSPQDKQTIGIYHESVLTKLWGARSSLKSLTAIEPLQIFTPGRPTDDLLRDRMTLAHHLDTFFVNAVSALEIAAQEVNLYYGLGFGEDTVSVWSIRDSLQARRPGSTIQNYYLDLTTPPPA